MTQTIDKTTEQQTQQRFQRWQDFALRMARTCFKKRTSPDEAWIVAQVESFFVEASDQYQNFISWDQSINSAGYVCDIVSETESDIWSNAWHYATPKEEKLLDEYWERGEQCIEQYDELKDEIADRWISPVHSCIRAGMDLAYEPSAGVLGFTAGDLRAMYLEGVPAWIKEGWEKDFDQFPDDASLWL